MLAVILLSSFISCTQSERALSESDIESINQIKRSYVNAWLANDSKTVLGLFTKDATIVPSGLSPINGIEEIEKYWFPNDSSVTTIHSYEIELLELHITDSMAYSLEKGTLNFTYTKGEFTLTKASVSRATTIYQKNKYLSWKIVSRM